MVTNRSTIISILFFFLIMINLLAVPSGVFAKKADAFSMNKSSPDVLQKAFKKASKKFDVPQGILMSVSYNMTQWNHHRGKPSTSGGYGVMHLTHVNQIPEVSAKGDGMERKSRSVAHDPKMHTLDQAAKLLGVSKKALKRNPVQNIRGGAALLAKYARQTVGETPNDLSDWYGAVAKYSGSDYKNVAKSFADRVYETIQEGVERTTLTGQHVVLKSEKVKSNNRTIQPLNLRNPRKTNTDCPNGLACRFIPALYEQFSSSPYNYGNYDLANRPEDGLDIKYIIIHDIEGTYMEGINTFLSQSYVSAHYVLRSTDGQITEMVRPKDIAWQAGNWYVNYHSIGLEHAGVAVEGAEWYSEPMYHASARLVKYLAERYDVPLDRQHIIGHDEVPGTSAEDQTNMHWDPGPYWNWKHYFELLGKPDHPRKKQGSSNENAIVTIAPKFHKNKPVLTYRGEQLEPQSSNFVYLRTAPSFDAPLLGDAALHPDGIPGTTLINDWGDKAVFGRSYYRADRAGDWTAIYYAGQKAWFHNPHGKKTVPDSGMLITPKESLESIPVYGMALPEDSAYEGTGIPQWARGTINKLQYRIPEGQTYVASGPFNADYYYAKLYNQPETNQVVEGETEYYQISFNHRIAFVKKSDVNVIRQSGEDNDGKKVDDDE
ncbi:N-acetylmuramoyl-L-alanine amidase [Virgibacillus siamensis]|uniref:N-acetylmuramoyl-L-alanine amidase n=1 Tax=Virgibacillus siamensis TaxID=480071 RepID=UPI001FE42D9B|nr:N-acetylmuramoyl-L-alanine amidase [Virgibacillus siamensis]